MLQLTSKQYETLVDLVEGNDTPIDGRSLQSLKNKGLVNQHEQATTSGWHRINRLRYTPPVRLLTQFEIESWQNYTIKVTEGPGNIAYDSDGDALWSRVDEVEYFLDFYKMVQWYADIKLQVLKAVESEWDMYLDCGGENSGVAARQHSVRTQAVNNVLSDSLLHYTSHIMYAITHSYVTGQTQRFYGSSSSYKYSLQDNEDEFNHWRTDKRPQPLNWRVSID